MKPGASVPRRNGAPRRPLRVPVLVAFLTFLVPTFGSGINAYINLDHRLTSVETNVYQLTRDQADQKAEVRDSLRRIDQKLDHLLYGAVSNWGDANRGGS